MTDSQAQVSDGTGAVLLHEDVLGLKVSVGNAWFTYPNIRYMITLVSCYL